ncbi:BspA family leucine-rich repeat surface protein [Croceitalea marina]|uniref:BspA family leucine-rich repeat surface protein n=1 Tax=Croceitalea marina TaxID=1775166 RepID=A0ABW5MVK1_9FLAO
MLRKLPLLLLFFSINIFAQEFRAIWNTANIEPGSSATDQVTIPTNPAYTTYNYDIDWGDGTSDTGVTGNITHTYLSGAGTYTISISGDFPAIYFNNETASDRLKIEEILQWGTIQWKTMENAFYGCQNINFDAIDSPDLSQVSSLKNMFRGATSFNGIVNNWDVSTITDISGIFAETEIFNRPLDNWTTANITDMSYAFYRARQFNEPLDNWNTGAVTNMEYLFSEASRFDQNINNWNVAQVTNMSGTFRYASSYNRPLNNWVVDNVTNMSYMLAGSAFDYPIENWNVSNVTDMSGMFYQASQFNQPIQGWDVSNVTDMNSMFARMPQFNQPLNGWNVSNVTNMANMFDGWPSLNTPFDQPLNGWDVSNVTDMSYMFRYTGDFNQPLNNWVVDNVTDMEHMFDRALAFNQDISGWNVASVTDMGSMFRQAILFNQDISSWNTAGVTDMSYMFYSAEVFNQPIGSWDVSNTRNMSYMFGQNLAFNQNLDSWNTSSVTNMRQMFENASAFNQSLASWNIGLVTNMVSMLSDSGLSQANYDATLIGWEGQTVQSNVSLGATNLNYCDALDERQNLIDNSGWNISGDIVNCSFVLCTNLVSPVNGDTNVPASANLTWAQTPNATGYRVTVRIIRGGVESIPFNDHDVPGGNTVGLNLETGGGADLLEPGDEVFVTIVPYNDTDGPATGCTEESFTVVPSWVNSPAAFKLTYDTSLIDTGTTPANQLRIETLTGYPAYLDYDYSIDWGDDQFDNNVTGDIVHTYLTPGIYTVSIIGDFPAPFHDYSGTDSYKLISIDQWGTQVWQSMERAFYYCENMEYNATDIPDLSNVTSMNSMFSGCNLFDGNINSWDVSNVTDMSSLFIGARSFNQPLNNWNVENVTSMWAMFLAATSFNQPLNNWNTGNVITMSRMFEQAEVFNQNINGWNVSNVTDMSAMFERAIAYNQPLNGWNVSNVTNMSKMFDGFVFDMVFDQPLDNWNVSNVTDMSFMFRRNITFNRPLNVWNTSNVTSMAGMFQDTDLFDQPLNNWNVSSVTNMQSMFSGAGVFNQNINVWNVTNVTTMSSMFNGAVAFNQPLNNWDVNSVVNMSSMFRGASAFNQPLNSWDVSAVATMASMFERASLFDQPLNSWNVSSVTLMNSMFQEASAFNNQIENWNVGSVTNMEAMFKDAIAFNQVIQNWDTGEVLTMEEMFHGASSFNESIDSWNTSFVRTMEGMFEDATSYNQTMNSWNVASVLTTEKMFKGAIAFNSDIGAWNVRGVETMEEMFSGASAFNQSINNWRVSGVNNMNEMFNEASSYNQAMDLWNLGNVSMRSTFFNATSLNQNLADWDVSGVSDMQDMLDNTALTRENYDNTLIAWSEQTLTSGITLGAEGLPYCDAQEERQSMIDNFGWSFSLDVRDCPIPECTQLASPLNGDTDVPVNTNITWDATLFAQGYRLTVGTSPGGNDVVNNLTITNETSYEFATDFNTSDVVYVTLIPFNDEGDAVGPCVEESFTISSDPATIPDCTNLNQPLDGTNDVVVTTDLGWNPISNADGYRLTVGTTSGGKDLVNDEDVGNTTTYEFGTDLPEDTDIFVTITPYNDEGDATSCLEESFDTELIPVPPICTNLTSPANNDTNVPVDTNLSWAPVANATGYLVSIGTTSGGIEVANNIDVGPNTTYDITDDLQGDRLHYVTIIPYNDEGDATGCTEETFRTIDSAIPPPSCTELIIPANGDTDIAIDLVSITWNSTPGATQYRITINGSTSNANDVTDLVVNGTTHSFANNFDNGENVTVTIVPLNGTVEPTSTCNTETFTIVDSAPSNNAFITTWETTVANETITVPTFNTETYDYDVDWGDGNIDTNVNGDATHTYTTPGIHTVSITGLFPRIYFDNSGDREKILTIEQWGSIEWTSMESAFYGCTNLNITNPSIDAPDLSRVTSLENTFRDTWQFNGMVNNWNTENVTTLRYMFGNSFLFNQDISNWDVRQVENMSFMFSQASFNQSLNNWQTDSLVDLRGMFSRASAYNQPMDNWNTENVTIMFGTFSEASSFNQDLSAWNVDKVTTMRSMFDNALAFNQDISGWNVGNVTEMRAMFRATPFNQDISGWDVGNVTTMQDMFVNATNFDQNLGNWDVSSLNNASSMFSGVQLSTANYDALLIGWNTRVLIADVVFDGGNSLYCNGAAARSAMTRNDNWTITDGGTTGPEIESIIDQNSVDNFTFPAITGTQLTGGEAYYTEPNGGGTRFDTGDVINFVDFPSYPVTIYIYDSSGTCFDEESFALNITNTGTTPACTSLIAPANEDTDVSVATDLTWNAVTDANGYRLTIGTSAGGNDILDNEDVGNLLTYNPPNDLPGNTEIFVTIVPYIGTENATGCAEESFTTEVAQPGCANLIIPTFDATDVPIDTNLTWNTATNAVRYSIAIGTSTGLDDILATTDVGNNTTFDPPADLPANTRVFVTITSFNAADESIVCGDDQFTTGDRTAVLPDCTALSSPLNGDSNVSADTDISWNAVANADGYRLTVGSSPGGNDIIDNFDAGDTLTFDFSGPFAEGITVYITITPYNMDGDALNCAEESFTIASPMADVLSCTVLTTPLNGATDVIEDTNIAWNEVLNANGYRLSVGTTAGGNDILDNEDVGILTLYQLPNNLPFEQQIFVTIIPYNADGDAENCEEQSFTTIAEVSPEIESLNGISPDGDGINEFWRIEGIEEYPNNTVVIYNRWGDMVYKVEGYNNTTNTFNGEANQLNGLGASQLPEGTYFFNIIIPETNNLKQTKGYLVLKR